MTVLLLVLALAAWRHFSATQACGYKVVDGAIYFGCGMDVGDI